MKRPVYRLFDGVSQREVGRRAGLSSGYLSHLCTGKRDITLRAAIAIAKALKTDVNKVIKAFTRKGR